MNKRYVLLALVIIMTFTGGIWTGIFYSTNNEQPHTEGDQIVEEQNQASETEITEEQEELTETADEKVLIGYMQDFRNPDSIDYSKLTHVIFSFVHPLKDGSVLFSSDSALRSLQEMVIKANETNTKVMLAIGGWSHMNGGESYDYFQAAISHSTSRTNLVNELMAIVDREGLDGIDIDFEHPRSNEDAANLTAFTKELSEQLHAKNLELSMAVHSKINAATGTESNYVIYEPATFQYVDHVNIMAYDGQWDGGYHAENLSPYSFTEHVVNYWSNLFDELDLSREKLVLGVPLYAQPEDSSMNPISYATIIENSLNNSETDTVSMNGTTYYYNGSLTMKKKTDLAIENGFGGIMMWETGLDAMGENSLTSVIYEELTQANENQAS
ncbi:MAG: glycoside hydrolase family 18 protein [Bacillus sp. (in: firmicutes)]